ncbi:MAG TPA: 16S rRNA (cytidine(1402)-2'-O)-methyltransferase [Aliidongia sp.]|nr:16S rRNA (cytidine(1402)-2'-O)-methyltransferase [Aliidongia sp.]
MPSKRGLAPGLYIVATPIGNAQDITLRALETLRSADTIACEDTRVSAKLLAIHGIRTPLLAYHDHNADRVRPQLLERLRGGERIALISDAGMPLVSDPGYKLVRDAIAAGLPVAGLPGPSAVLAALVLSGLPSDRFLFMGFLDAKSAGRRRQLAEVAALRTTLIFFESGPRLAASLADMTGMLGDRPAAVARELTKLYEEVARGTLGELARRYERDGPPRGEIVVVIGPPLDRVVAPEEIDEMLREALGRLSLRDAASEVATRLDQPRREIYARALALGKP